MMDSAKLQMHTPLWLAKYRIPVLKQDLSQSEMAAPEDPGFKKHSVSFLADLFSVYSVARDQILELACARQVVYHWATTPDHFPQL